MEKLETGRERSLAKRDLAPKVIAEVTKELPTILTPYQWKRLQQNVKLQTCGPPPIEDCLDCRNPFSFDPRCSHFTQGPYLIS